ncbi:hypothetical protein HPC62_19555 [Thermoleptolyngbya sichuanensis A183]|uniref:Uncharacterized protein n=1 Tax=Thermoleptolyngbya sichuanensis A183 TaxID=2737172 RepID=A0A6M8BKD1_9CYAN|nr:hypothetical protein [Thermoleptolyngbya sichuanensis]QKD84081.1 hypothetical protein HPC62_19555 [Thermoleptolyngbya sichuanensis A183]
MKESPAAQPTSMPASQVEIRAIQERLQAIRAGQVAVSSSPASRMVEMFPAKSAAPGRMSANREAIPTGIAPPERPLERSRAGVAAQNRPTDADVTAAVRIAAAEAQQAAELQQAAESLRAMSAALTSTFVPSAPSGVPSASFAAGAAPVAAASPKTPIAAASGRRSHPEAPTRPEFPAAEVMRLLEVKADEINQLSAAQEAAMLELKAIAQKLERDWKALDTQQYIFAGEASDLPALCEYLDPEVPLVQRDDRGAFVVTKRPVDLFQAERDAEWMAQSLRHRGDGHSSGSVGGGRRHRSTGLAPAPSSSAIAIALTAAQRTLRGLMALVSQVLLPSDRQRTARSMQRQSTPATAGRPPMTEAPSMQTSAVLLIGAAIARIGADWLLAVNAGFWLPVALLIVAPAALAIYRTTVAPHTSITWGYRIFLIFLGLLIGGRVL